MKGKIVLSYKLIYNLNIFFYDVILFYYILFHFEHFYFI